MVLFWTEVSLNIELYIIQNNTNRSRNNTLKIALLHATFELSYSFTNMIKILDAEWYSQIHRFTDMGCMSITSLSPYIKQLNLLRVTNRLVIFRLSEVRTFLFSEQCTLVNQVSPSKPTRKSVFCIETFYCGRKYYPFERSSIPRFGLTWNNRTSHQRKKKTTTWKHQPLTRQNT